MDSKHLCGNIKIINNYFENQFNSGLASFNLTRSQMDVLIFLKVNEKKEKEVNQKDIEKYFSLKNPTVTGILDRLENKGYIERKVSTKDKRHKEIILTASSNEILDEGKRLVRKIEKKLLCSLNNDEQEKLKELLYKIICGIKEEIC